jgi:GT2 family glycosyltransferase
MSNAPQTTPELSIIIVNWNSRDFVGKCLESIHRNAGELSCEILVVDNASYDGCDRMVKAHFPDVVFLQCEQNIGFARANNLAFEQTTGRNILFLNPDTEIQGAALQNLIAVLHSLPGIGMVGARLLNSDMSLQDNCITALPNIPNQILGSNFLRRALPKSQLWGKRAFFAKPQKPAQVEAISGACMLAKREVVEAVGCFSTDYFMYCEDMDLCVKIARAGFSIYYAPDAAIVHHAGGSSASRSESDFSSIMIRESLMRYFTIHRGAGYAALFRAGGLLASALRLAFLLMLLPAALHPAGYRRVPRALRKWTNILAWSCGATSWAARKPAAKPDARVTLAPRLENLPESSPN